MKTLKGFLFGLFVFLVIYLAGVFTNASFNILEWTQDSRLIVAIIGTTLGLITFGIYLTPEKQ